MQCILLVVGTAWSSIWSAGGAKWPCFLCAGYKDKLAEKDGVVEKLYTEATDALKVKGRADVPHAKEVKGERPPFILSFSPVTSTIRARRISAAGAAR
jgi:hypothetical protein